MTQYRFHVKYDNFYYLVVEKIFSNEIYSIIYLLEKYVNKNEDDKIMSIYYKF